MLHFTYYKIKINKKYKKKTIEIKTKKNEISSIILKWLGDISPSFL